MPSAIESPSSPSRRTPRAERRLAGRFLLQAAALLGVVVAIALALVALRPGDEPRPPTAASSTDPAPTNAPDAPTLAAAPERGLDRSPEPLADAAPSPTAERSEADTARLDSMNGAALAASSANAPDKSSSRAPRPDAGEAVAGPQADGARWGPADRPSRPASPILAASGATGFTGSNASASGEVRPSAPVQASSEAAGATEQPPVSTPATSPHRTRTKSEIIESSKRLHELRLEALRQSGQLPQED